MNIGLELVIAVLIVLIGLELWRWARAKAEDPPPNDPPSPAASADATLSPRFWVKTVITAGVLAVALYIILSQNYSAASEKWSYGAIGIILGYWLRQ
jgi:hypothetical protein